MDFDLVEEPVWQGVVEKVIRHVCHRSVAPRGQLKLLTGGMPPSTAASSVMNRDRKFGSRTLDARMRQLDESIRPPKSASSALVDPEQAFALRKAILKVGRSSLYWAPQR